MKKLLILPLLLLLIFLSSCETKPIQFDNHEFELKYNQEEHYEECSCGDIKNITAHTLDEGTIRLEPTCTEKGIKEYKCNSCDFIKYEDIEPLGHIEIIDKAIEVGCENEGLTEGSHCERCNQVLTKQESIECEGHTYSEFETVTPAACEKEGLKKKVCTKCNNEVFNTIPALEHEYSEFEVVTPATCELEGVEKKVCKKCEKEVINKIPAKNHNLTYEGYKASTCVVPGQTDTTYCADCNKIITPSKELELANHVWRVYKTTEPTYASAGMNYVICDKCKQTDQKLIQILTPQEDIFDTLLTSEMLNQNIRIFLEEGYTSYDYIVSDNIIYYSKQIFQVENLTLTTEKHYFMKIDDSKSIRIDYVNDVYTHSVYTEVDEDLLKLQADFINKVTCLKEVYSSFKWYANPAGSAENVVCYNDKIQRVNLLFTEEGALTELYLTNGFTLECYYDDINVKLPMDVNIHSIPTNNVCPDCNLTCRTATLPNETYTENYYMYEDGLVTYEYILTDETATAQIPSFKNRTVTYNEDYGYYKIDQLKYTRRSTMVKLVDSYSYSSLTGIITVELTPITSTSPKSTVYFYTMKDEIEYSEDGYFTHSGGFHHPEGIINKSFIEYTENKVYVYTFTEGFYVRETYDYGTVYLYKGKAFGNVFGRPLEYFLNLEKNGFTIDENHNSYDVYTKIEDFSISISITDGRYYQGTIYDIVSIDQGNQIIYFVSGDGKRYEYYLYASYSLNMGKVKEIE